MSVDPAPRRNRLRVWYRPMTGRDRSEEHRASTPLELLFDLCFVVAVSQAGAQLHHSLAEHDIGHGIVLFLFVFFALWWGWVNFTWFASAFDTDDVPYRLATFVQIAGALVVAAGVPAAWHDDLTTIVVGYVLMRLAMVAQWLRAARTDDAHRPTALRFALGITIVQIGWVLRLAVPHSWFVPSFLVLVAAELLVPVWAERATSTTWHPRHIAERYGLFTLIVLGESVLAATNALQERPQRGRPDLGGRRRTGDRVFDVVAVLRPARAPAAGAVPAGLHLGTGPLRDLRFGRGGGRRTGTDDRPRHAHR
jgi:low temperature requirement protein LtrA